MNSNSQLIIRAVTAVTMVAMMLVALVLNPWIAAGLAPVLIAVAAILREVSARRSGQDYETDRVDEHADVDDA